MAGDELVGVRAGRRVGGRGDGRRIDDRWFVKTTEDRAAAAGHSVDAEEWLAEFDTGFAAIAGRFGRVEPRRQARAFLLGLLSDVDTRSCWQLAEQAGDTSPQPMQRLLGEAIWDADQARDDVRGYAVDALGDPQGVLILDDTGDLKKGGATVGTQRHYTGTAGRIENAQVAVYLAYATPVGSALIDREVYLPKAWTDDPARCAAAGVPDRVRFATKITLGRRMLARALDAGVPAAWATADEFYGGDQHLRRDLQTRGVGYVLAVAKSHRIIACAATGRHAPTGSPPSCPAGPGTGSPPAPGRKVSGSTTGRGSPSRHRPVKPLAATACSSAAASATANWPSTAAGHPDRCRCTCWSGSREPGGTWRPASRPESASAWTSRRCAGGTPGIGTSRWSCSPTPSSPSSPPANATTTPTRR
jgi:hypothetical protein